MISVPSSSECLLDFGSYQYFENDSLKNIEEPWTQHQRDDTIITRVKRVAADFDQYFEVQTWSKAGEFERALLSWRSGLYSAQADYCMAQGRWAVNRNVNGRTFSDKASANLVFSPLMRVFVGESIQKIVAMGGKAGVLVPWIKDPSAPDKMFSVNISQRQAYCLDSKAGLYSYQGEQYDESARFTLNENNLLTRYEWRMNENSHWRAELERPALSQLNADWL